MRWMEAYRSRRESYRLRRLFIWIRLQMLGELVETQLGNVPIVNRRMEGCLGAHQVPRLSASLERCPSILLV